MVAVSRTSKLFFPIEIEDIEHLTLDIKNKVISFSGNLLPEDCNDVAVTLHLSQLASRQLIAKLADLQKLFDGSDDPERS
ncbi:hypothetical protein [Celerinatantimonas sp. YJH-8]|uniref:hypothetical protein n=1 Tax=Celerinatantimonas sp. YJH-8 TaxID=3228714 RepID=UPI0038BED7C6